MIIFLYGLYISVWVQYFWGPPLKIIYPKQSSNESSYKEVLVNTEIINPCPAEQIKIPCLLIIFSQSDN